MKSSARVLAPRVVAAATALLGCRGHPSPDECRATIDHYLDLALRETPGSASLSSGQAAAVRDVQRGLKRAEPSYRRVEDECPSLTGAEVSCALGATTTRAWESCVHTSDAR